MMHDLATNAAAAKHLGVCHQSLLEPTSSGLQSEHFASPWMVCELVHALLPSDRRVFSRAEAASYVSASVGYFDKLIRLGKMPQALPLPGVKRWDKNALDRAIDALSGMSASTSSTPVSPLDAWRRSRG